MKDLISREVLLAKLWKATKGYRMVQEIEAVKNCIFEVKEAPAVDAVPVRYGKWIVKRYSPGGRGRTVRFCSECGANNWNRKSNYCPNCGADMRGE